MNLHRAFQALTGALLATFLLAMSPVVWGQAVNGTLLGTITDSTGASVGGARIVATSTSTGAIHESTTNESGNYTFPDMQPGAYSVTIEARGFKKATQQSIDLASNSSIRVDMVLQTGDVSETIMVTTAPPVLQTRERVVVREVGDLTFLLVHAQQPAEICREEFDVFAVLVGERLGASAPRSESEDEDAVPDSERRRDGRAEPVGLHPRIVRERRVALEIGGRQRLAGIDDQRGDARIDAQRRPVRHHIRLGGHDLIDDVSTVDAAERRVVELERSAAFAQDHLGQAVAGQLDARQKPPQRFESVQTVTRARFCRGALALFVNALGDVSETPDAADGPSVGALRNGISLEDAAIDEFENVEAVFFRMRVQRADLVDERVRIFQLAEDVSDRAIVVAGVEYQLRDLP